MPAIRAGGRQEIGYQNLPALRHSSNPASASRPTGAGAQYAQSNGQTPKIKLNPQK